MICGLSIFFMFMICCHLLTQRFVAETKSPSSGPILYDIMYPMDLRKLKAKELGVIEVKKKSLIPYQRINLL
jgi:hypothetical protein